MTTEVIDIVTHAMNDDAVGVADAFDTVIKGKILDALAARQADIMRDTFGDDAVADDGDAIIPDLEA